MLFRRLKTPGLAHHSYLLECGAGQAVVVDPRRDVGEYLSLAKEAGLSIAYVLQTHRQEDFEHGARSLAELAGAKIVAGEHALFGRADVRLRDGEALEVAETRFVALHTPGHTPEGVCYAAYRKDAGPRCWALFSGDSLFVGETGRTDLADPARTAENAGLLYDALREKVAPLGAQALVFPAHGAGSACGGNIGERDDSSLGTELDTNPAFTLERGEFVRRKVEERLPRPPYFARMERLNLEAGRPLTGGAPRVLQPKEFERAMREGIVIDARGPDAFAAAHIPRAYNIWLGGLSTFAGWVAEEGTPIFLVVPSPAQVDAALLALARVGLDSVAGVLAGGVPAWRERGLPIARFGTASAGEVATRREKSEVTILDVRDRLEWEEGHIPGALHVYVGDVERSPPKLAKDATLVVHCSVGNRSGLAASMLERLGHARVCNMLGGFKAWRSLGLPTEQG